MGDQTTKLETKPGIKTTEFWVGLVLPQLLALAVAFGVFTPEQSDVVSNTLLDIVASSKEIIAAVISGASALGYNIGRGIAKSNVNPNE